MPGLGLPAAREGRTPSKSLREGHCISCMDRMCDPPSIPCTPKPANPKPPSACSDIAKAVAPLVQGRSHGYHGPDASIAGSGVRQVPEGVRT